MQEKIDVLEIRDAFLEFMISLMASYTKCLIAPNSQQQIFNDARDFFDFKKFRSIKDATKPNTLIYKVTETAMFAQFIECRSFGKSDQDDSILWFDEISLKKRSRKQPLLLQPF